MITPAATRSYKSKVPFFAIGLTMTIVSQNLFAHFSISFTQISPIGLSILEKPHYTIKLIFPHTSHYTRKHSHRLKFPRPPSQGAPSPATCSRRAIIIIQKHTYTQPPPKCRPGMFCIYRVVRRGHPATTEPGRARVYCLCGAGVSYTTRRQIRLQRSTFLMGVI